MPDDRSLQKLSASQRGPARAAVLLLVSLLAAQAQAGQNCDPTPPSASAVTQGLTLALRSAQALDASAAEVVLLARAGQNLSRYGLRWSHLAYAYRETAAAADRGGIGVWRVVHKLNQCGSDQGALYRQGLGEFFLDRPDEYRAAYLVLKPELQAALLPLLRNNAQALALHEPRYNMLAYPWSLRYQQSNQWALELLAQAAQGPATIQRADAQAWLKARGYRPTELHLDTLTRLGTRLTRVNIAFDDQPFEPRMAGRIETVTVDSIFSWLPQAGFGQNAVQVP